MNVGIVGAGCIASKMARTIREMDDVTCYGIASRDLMKGKEFAEKFDIGHIFGSYEEMMKDDAIDMVYIATPHPFHKEHTMLALQHGKHVLCEKPFMVNEKEAKEVIDYAKEKKLLVAEAIWTRYMPSRKIIDDIIADGKVGEVKSVSANLGYEMSTKERIVNPNLAGGALLDVGVYALNFTAMILGTDMDEIISTCTKSESGMDLQNAIIFKYPDGALATMHSGALAATEQYGMVYGSKGYIMAKNINNVDEIQVYNLDNELEETHFVPEQITGFEDQVRACKKAIEEGKLECEEMPHTEILRIMQIMDGLRADWGIKYPFE